MARRSDAPVRRPTVSVQVLGVPADGTARRRPDVLATEEPLEIRAHGPLEPPTPVAVTLRTPGHDFELAAGFLFAEGILDGPDDVARIQYCIGPEGEQEYNVVTVRTRGAVTDAIRPRNFSANASCGLCGKTMCDDLELRASAIDATDITVFAASMLRHLPDRVRAQQPAFSSTGGVHAAAQCDANGQIIAVREDIGRHNALDKVVGRAFLARELPWRATAVVVSGRLGYELVQKAAAAGAGVIVAVGAPSSLAVAAAEACGLTVVGFARADHLNVYTHPERIDPKR